MNPKFVFLIFLFWGLFFDSPARAQKSFIRLLGKTYEGSRIQLAAFPDGSCGILLEDSLQFMKTTPCGALQWSKRWNNSLGLRGTGVNSFCGTRRGGLAWVGQFTSDGLPQMEGVFILTDSLGNVISQKHLTVQGQNFFPYSIHEEKSGNFLIYGNLNPVGGGDASLAVFRLGENGQIINVRFWAHGGIWGGSVLLPEGGILTRSGSGFFKWDNNLQVNWGFGFPISGNYYESPVPVSGGFIISASGSAPGSFALYKISPNGQGMPETFTSYPEIKGKFRLISDDEGGLFGLFLKSKNGLARPTIAHWDSNLKMISCHYLPDPDPGHQFQISDLQMKNGILWFAGKIVINNLSTPFIVKWKENQNTCLQLDTFASQNEPEWHLIQAFIPNAPQFIYSVGNFSGILNPTPLFENPYFCGAVSPKELFLGSDTALCGKQEIELKNQRNFSFSAYDWSTGAKSPSIFIHQPGKYWLKATEACEDLIYSDTLEISSIPIPEKPLTDSILCQFNMVQLPGAPELWKGQWENGSPGLARSVQEPGKYALQINHRHCLTHWVFQVSECVEWELPNLLTANFDNLNETFTPKLWKGLKPGELTIYDRWGKKIWSYHQYPVQVWNPENQSDGIYFWQLNTVDREKRAVIGNGWIQVLKSK